ncbi:hypothetical protein T265_09011 [Opisthorchis viverrini]|uniref:Uncharacterized protein n=1 Tax=Opisthorchis viverrini TaxID=6198 RepID=A0A074ZI62_OPIVI|nr:hypothetical protein T265_09011 [Opisthorchis viverrini]KER23000.1 hypothetical protein T265_09011 [Opisthorchis viverrini]
MPAQQHDTTQQSFARRPTRSRAAQDFYGVSLTDSQEYERIDEIIGKLNAACFTFLATIVDLMFLIQPTNAPLVERIDEIIGKLNAACFTFLATIVDLMFLIQPTNAPLVEGVKEGTDGMDEGNNQHESKEEWGWDNKEWVGTGSKNKSVHRYAVRRIFFLAQQIGQMVPSTPKLLGERFQRHGIKEGWRAGREREPSSAITFAVAEAAAAAAAAADDKLELVGVGGSSGGAIAFPTRRN